MLELGKYEFLGLYSRLEADEGINGVRDQSISINYSFKSSIFYKGRE